MRKPRDFEQLQRGAPSLAHWKLHGRRLTAAQLAHEAGISRQWAGKILAGSTVEDPALQRIFDSKLGVRPDDWAARPPPVDMPAGLAAPVAPTTPGALGSLEPPALPGTGTDAQGGDGDDVPEGELGELVQLRRDLRAARATLGGAALSSNLAVDARLTAEIVRLRREERERAVTTRDLVANHPLVKGYASTGLAVLRAEISDHALRGRIIQRLGEIWDQLDEMTGALPEGVAEREGLELQGPEM
jgi:hypothetical protein